MLCQTSQRTCDVASDIKMFSEFCCPVSGDINWNLHRITTFFPKRRMFSKNTWHLPGHHVFLKNHEEKRSFLIVIPIQEVLSIVVISSTASVNNRTCFSQVSRKTSIFSNATFDVDRAESILAALTTYDKTDFFSLCIYLNKRTCGERCWICIAAKRTSLIPSAWSDIEQATLAT